MPLFFLTESPIAEPLKGWVMKSECLSSNLNSAICELCDLGQATELSTLIYKKDTDSFFRTLL